MADQSEETKAERLNRNLSELLQELRIALPGVQVLFAFLLTVPFSQGFAQMNSFQRNLYFGILLAAALATALLIAPSAAHRLLFREHDKEFLVEASNALAIAGLMVLALAMTGVIVLISDYVFGGPVVKLAGGATALVFLTLWLVAPLVRRSKVDLHE